jgi:hypothetical protein
MSSFEKDSADGSFESEEQDDYEYDDFVVNDESEYSSQQSDRQKKKKQRGIKVNKIIKGNHHG